MSGIAAIKPVASKPDLRLEPLREAVGKVVGSVFYERLLQTMRKSPLKGDLGGGGRGGEVFQGQLDAELASRAGVAGNSSLTESLLKRLGEQQLRMGKIRDEREEVAGSQEQDADEETPPAETLEGGSSIGESR